MKVRTIHNQRQKQREKGQGQKERQTEKETERLYRQTERGGRDRKRYRQR